MCVCVCVCVCVCGGGGGGDLVQVFEGVVWFLCSVTANYEA